MLITMWLITKTSLNGKDFGQQETKVSIPLTSRCPWRSHFLALHPRLQCSEILLLRDALILFSMLGHREHLWGQVLNLLSILSRGGLGGWENRVAVSQSKFYLYLSSGYHANPPLYTRMSPQWVLIHTGCWDVLSPCALLGGGGLWMPSGTHPFIWQTLAPEPGPCWRAGGPPR